MRWALLYADGACRGSPGQAGIGGVIRLGGRSQEFSLSIGLSTNNVAEYRALLEALERARAMGAEAVEVRLDAELLVRQIEGSYRVRDEKLKPLYQEVRRLLEGFKRYRVVHVPREQNKRADALARQAIRG